MGVQKLGYVNFVNSIRRTLLICILFSIFLIQTGTAADPQIKLTTNRYIILDDPNSGYSGVTANNDAGFGKPWNWNTDAWRDESTTIRGVALLLDSNGAPASGITVTFSAQDWNDPSPRALKSDTNNKTNITNAYGLATASFDLNNEQQYGRWKVTATATVNGTPVSSSSNFVYNWWGCQNCHGNPYSQQGRGNENYPSRISPGSTRYDPYSPYVTGRDFHNEMYTSHHLPTGGDLVEGECWACHNSYDRDLNLGQERRTNGTSYGGKGVPSTYGTHANKTCADCHSIIGSSTTGAQTVKSCDATGCHQGATDFNSHVGQEGVVATSPSKYVNYSGQDLNPGLRSYSGIYPTAATFNSSPLTGARAHTSATVQNIPCTVCHGPMHNVTKPDINTAPKNTVTEDTQCTTCHQSLKHSNSDPVYCTTCHSQDAHTINIINKTATSQPSYVFIGSANAITSSISDCEQCHAPGAEANFFASLTTFDSAAYSRNFAPATPVHNRHNGTVGCDVCHDSTNFHNMTYLTAGGTYSISNASAVTCTDCHSGQNSAVRNTVNSRLGRLPPVVNTPANHSTDGAGVHWGTYWTSANGACLYCHGDNKHNETRLGNVSIALGSDPIGGAIGTGTVCSSCHDPDDSNYNATMGVLSPDPVANKPGNANWNTSGVDHTSYGATDADCKLCHGSVLSGSADISEFLHNVDSGKSGGRDCVGCHDKGKSTEKIDVSKMNQSDSIHNFLNDNSIIVTPGLNPDNKRCWACHTNSSISTDNVVNEAELPTSGHPDSYNVPKKCTQCHIQGNFSALVVSEHFSGSTEIRTKSYASTNDSCVNCHNKSEMLLPNSDPSGPKSIYASVSHYGSNKTNDVPYISGSSANCSYCHQNPASAFTTEMNDAAWNSTISNHTALDTSPACTNCHNSGRIHFATLTKPAVSSTLCTDCHANKDKHNSLVECSQCHIQSSKNIHPIQYLQPDGSYKTNSQINKSTAVNCTNCHQGTGMNGFNSAPIIPDPLKHSASLSNGTIWGTYWTSEQDACYYCHGNMKHNNTALGQINSLMQDTNNTKNGVLTTTTWCADCHYSDAANTNYFGSQWSPEPPGITVNNTGKSGWEDHSSYVASGYKDEKCRSCHALNGAYDTNSLNYSHSLDVGVSGGADCISCHYVGSSYHNIDTIAANASVHFGMNSNNATSAGLAAIDGACWACHDTDGNITNNPGNKIMGDIYNTPKKCDDCHLASGTYYSQASGWGAPTVSEHYYSGDQIKAGNSDSNIASCINCHENVSEMVLSNNDPDYGSFAGDGVRLTGGSMSSYHYGKPRQDIRTWDTGQAANCSYCHQNTDTAFAIGMVNSGYNSSIQNHSSTQASPDCYNSSCHSSGWIHNSTLTRPALIEGSAATLCQNCHTSKQNHNGTLDCSNCHINQSSSDTIHPIKFVQDSGTFDLTRTSAAKCTNCHQGSGLSGFSAPKVPEPVNHSTSPSAGQKWGNYWDNTSQITACYYCHQNEIHTINADLLGNVSTVQGSNTFNNADLANSTWCANCHYAEAPEYEGMSLPVPPPEITDASLVASDGTIFFNHSGLSGFSDSNCKGCHGRALSGYSETSLNLSHSVSEGAGESCIECHGTNYIGASPSVASTFVNISAFNESIHQDINNTPPAAMDNLDCWSCHYNRDMSRSNVKKCGDCHRKPSQWHGNATITTNLSELW